MKKPVYITNKNPESYYKYSQFGVLLILEELIHVQMNRVVNQLKFLVFLVTLRCFLNKLNLKA